MQGDQAPFRWVYLPRTSGGAVNAHALWAGPRESTQQRPSPTSSVLFTSQVNPFLPPWQRVERDLKGREAVVFQIFWKREKFLFYGKGEDLQRGFLLHRNSLLESKPSSRLTVDWQLCDFSGVLKWKVSLQSSPRMVGERRRTYPALGCCHIPIPWTFLE